MSIRRMTGASEAGLPNVETVDGKGWGLDRPLYMKTTHVGLVLELRERNMRDDSDFYAIVWNPDKGAPEQVEYASTRGWTYPNGANVDATPEVLAAYHVFCVKRDEDARRAREIREAQLPLVGRVASPSMLRATCSGSEKTSSSVITTGIRIAVSYATNWMTCSRAITEWGSI